MSKIFDKISRRRVLRGVYKGSVLSVGLPVFDQMLNDSGTAFANGNDIPMKFGVLLWGNGIQSAFWNPKGTGSNWQPAECTQPFIDRGIKSDITIISGLNSFRYSENPCDNGHHDGTSIFLTGRRAQYDRGCDAHYSIISGPSVDQIVKKKWNPPTRVSTLEIGVIDNATTSEGSTLMSVSHNGPNSLNEPNFDIGKVFSILFKDFGLTSNSSNLNLAASSNLSALVVDLIRQDAADLRKRLGSADRYRLDQHLQALFEIEKQSGSGSQGPGGTSAGTCRKPEKPSNDGDWAKKARVMAQLLAMGLACDQTRIFSVMLSGSVGGYKLPGTNSYPNYHAASHEDGDGSKNWEEYRPGLSWTMSQLAKFVEELKNVSIGSGTLLDHMAMICGTDCGESHTHSENNHPVIVVGNAKGRLKQGVHINGNNQSLTKPMLSVLRAVGVEMPSFGDNGARRVTSGLSELES